MVKMIKTEYWPQNKETIHYNHGFQIAQINYNSRLNEIKIERQIGWYETGNRRHYVTRIKTYSKFKHTDLFIAAVNSFIEKYPPYKMSFSRYGFEIVW